MNFIEGYEETNFLYQFPIPQLSPTPNSIHMGTWSLFATNLERFQMKSFILKNKK